MMNYGGKVYSVLRGIEVAAGDIDPLNRALFVSYSVFMALGMYWYTRFWLDDLDTYYDDRSNHYLTKTIGNIPITLGAAMYYAIFCGLFAWSYIEISHPVSMSLAIWNAWCCINLLFATPFHKNDTITTN
jgi:hypothetical protein